MTNKHEERTKQNFTFASEAKENRQSTTTMMMMIVDKALDENYLNSIDYENYYHEYFDDEFEPTLRLLRKNNQGRYMAHDYVNDLDKRFDEEILMHKSHIEKVDKFE